jgi:hypothetical protein
VAPALPTLAPGPPKRRRCIGGGGAAAPQAARPRGRPRTLALPADPEAGWLFSPSRLPSYPPPAPPQAWNRPPQLRLTQFTSNGIFTSNTFDPDWADIHGLLPRFFNAMKVQGFYPMSEPPRRPSRRHAACLPRPRLRAQPPVCHPGAGTAAPGPGSRPPRHTPRLARPPPHNTSHRTSP